jgi:tetratricopeptide (TPR) repeat protein
VFDPFTAAAGERILESGVKGVWNRLRASRAGDELHRLTKQLERYFENDEHVAASGFAYIRESAEVASRLDEFFRTGELDRVALAAEIAKYIKPVSDAAPPVDEIADRVVRAIDHVSHQIFAEPLQQQIFEMRRATSKGDVRREEASSGIHVLTLDWSPNGMRRHLERFAKLHSIEAAQLDIALQGQADPARVVRGLVAQPPDWAEKASGDLWSVLGRLAAANGLWDEAIKAFLQAVERPVKDRAGALAQAAESAGAVGRKDEARQLLDRARQLEPTHPAVAMLTARELDDPDERLRLLEQANAVTPEQEGALAASRALALASMRRFVDAHKQAELAIDRAPESPFVREANATLTLFEAFASRTEVDWQALEPARDTYLELSESLRSVGRNDEATQLIARAAEVYAVAGEFASGARLVDEVARAGFVQNASLEARTHLADAAISLQRFDLLLILVPEEEEEVGTDEARLIRAHVAWNEGKKTQAVAALDSILKRASNESVKRQAALSRLSFAVDENEIAWSDPAENVLREHDEDIVQGLRAMRQANEGDVPGAEKTLLEMDDPRAQDLLADFAIQRGDLPLAVTRLDTVIAKAATPRRRLRLAGLLLELGETARARTELEAVRADAHAPNGARADATLLATKEAYDAHRYDDSARLAQERLVLAAEDPRALWVLVESLMRLGRFEEAKATYDQHQPTARSLGEARIAAHLLSRVADRVEAIKAIADLSDSFNREDETLEGLLILSYQRRAGAALPEELEQRVGEALSTFPDRFPDSGFARRVEIEDFEAIVQQQHELTVQELSAIADGIRAGRLPATLVAASLGEAATSAYGSLAQLPLGFGDPALEELERRDAAAALEVGALFDPTALYVVGGLPASLRARILRALGRPRLAQAVLDDAVFGGRDAADDTVGEEQRVRWDAVAGRPVIVTRLAEEVAATQSRTRAIHQLARDDLEVVPNVDREHPTRFDKNVPAIEHPRDLVAATFAGTLSAAERLKLAVYSDDRVVRLVVRNEGIPSFGTLALLDALVDRGLLGEAERREVRTILRASGGLGIRFSSEDELLEAIERADYTLGDELRTWFSDPSQWLFDALDFDHRLLLLERVLENRPDDFRVWLARVIDAAHEARRREGLELQVVRLLAIALLTREATFGRALLNEMRQLLAFDPLPKTLPVAATQIALAIDLPYQGQMLAGLLARLDPVDEVRIIGAIEQRWARVLPAKPRWFS